MSIKLYYMPGTRALRPRWLLEELQIPYTLHAVDLFAGDGNKPAYRKVQPFGLLPAIEVDDHIQYESGAICHWLTDQYPEKNLAPVINSPARRLYEQWMFFAPGTLEPPAWLMIQHTKIFSETLRVKDIVPWALKQLNSVLEILNIEMQNKNYLVDNKFSTADIMVGSIIAWFPDIMQQYPNLQHYAASLIDRDAYKRAQQALTDKTL